MKSPRPLSASSCVLVSSTLTYFFRSSWAECSVENIFILKRKKSETRLKIFFTKKLDENIQHYLIEEKREEEDEDERRKTKKESVDERYSIDELFLLKYYYESLYSFANCERTGRSSIFFSRKKFTPFLVDSVHTLF